MAMTWTIRNRANPWLPCFTSILMSRRPDEVRMLMIDPKMVELTPYKTLPHLMHPVVTDMKKAEAILAWAVEKMEQRYALLASAGVRHISKYNELDREEVLRRINPASEEEAEQIPEKIPFIVVIADVDTLVRVCHASDIVKRINVGGVHEGEGRRRRLRYVFLSDSESESLKMLESEGVEVTARDVPSAKPVPLSEFV